MPIPAKAEFFFSSRSAYHFAALLPRRVGLHHVLFLRAPEGPRSDRLLLKLSRAPEPQKLLIAPAPRLTNLSNPESEAASAMLLSELRSLSPAGPLFFAAPLRASEKASDALGSPGEDDSMSLFPGSRPPHQE